MRPKYPTISFFPWFELNSVWLSVRICTRFAKERIRVWTRGKSEVGTERNADIFGQAGRPTGMMWLNSDFSYTKSKWGMQPEQYVIERWVGPTDRVNINTMMAWQWAPFCGSDCAQKWEGTRCITTCSSSCHGTFLTNSVLSCHSWRLYGKSLAWVAHFPFSTEQVIIISKHPSCHNDEFYGGLLINQASQCSPCSLASVVAAEPKVHSMYYSYKTTLILRTSSSSWLLLCFRRRLYAFLTHQACPSTYHTC